MPLTPKSNADYEKHLALRMAKNKPEGYANIAALKEHFYHVYWLLDKNKSYTPMDPIF